ncbi:hypothetical protein E4U41_005691 [Claviceps citrina]|nr:hypothetical protein E4U41_005691 [Claviceps citrina]
MSPVKREAPPHEPVAGRARAECYDFSMTESELHTVHVHVHDVNSGDLNRPHRNDLMPRIHHSSSLCSPPAGSGAFGQKRVRPAIFSRLRQSSTPTSAEDGA